MIKLFITKRPFMILLLSVSIAGVLLLFYYASVLKLTLQDSIEIHEIGLVPTITISFKQPIDNEAAQKTAQDIYRRIGPDYIRTGYRYTNQVRFEWDKSGRTIDTTFLADIIGWKLGHPMELLVRSNGDNMMVPCYKMDSVKGFYIPIEHADELGSDIIIHKAFVHSHKTYSMELNLKAQAYNPKELIDGAKCVRFSTPKPNNRSDAEHMAFRKLKDDYYIKISRCLALTLGDKFWKTINAGLKNNIFRFFNKDAVAIPSVQIWDDLCGLSLQKSASFKELKVREEVGGEVLFYPMEFWGYFRSRFNRDVSGYMIVSTHQRLMRKINSSKPIFNFIELEFSFNKLSRSVAENIAAVLSASGFQQSDYTIIPWHAMANHDKAVFLQNLIRTINSISIMFLVIVFLMFMHICKRAANAFYKDWKIVIQLGGNKAYFIFILGLQLLICFFTGGIIALLSLWSLNAYVINPVHVNAGIETISMFNPSSFQLIPLLIFMTGIYSMVLYWNVYRKANRYYEN